MALETLRELVDLARLTPSASNRQPLRYILSADPQTNARIFPAPGLGRLPARLARPGGGRAPHRLHRHPAGYRGEQEPPAATTASPPRPSCWARPSAAWAAA